MRLLICAGGTGGGVNPALAVLQALENKSALEDGSVLWVGSEQGMERDLVARAGVPFEPIPAAGIHGVGLRRLPGNLLRLGQGYKAAGQILRRFQPDAMFFTGGYVAVPVALAGRKVPSMIYVPDIEPGLALKFLALISQKIAVSVEESRKFFSNRSKVVVTGYPTRSELRTWTKQQAIHRFGLDPEIPVLLVVGGSSGARSINRALMGALAELITEMQILHVTGSLDWEEVSANREGMLASKEIGGLVDQRYQIFSYLHEDVGAALSAADLVLARAGASVLGEFPLFRLPAILVPYPFAWRYQMVNAEYLAARQAAVILKDEELPDQLASLVRQLIRDREKRAQMRQAMGSLAVPEAAASIAELLVGLVQPEGRRRA
jgi:UDP-N-acetylglucosamine--N-acetylmuramyl-(pentapeptide) pyrophosphoryl-undecaprenol N-acetylglucosamine transferase